MKTKTNILFIIYLFTLVSVAAQRKSDTYVTTIIPKENLNTINSVRSDNVLTSTQYYDGLLRPIGEVQLLLSPTGKDIYTSVEYDAYGRESKVWLPAVYLGDGTMPILSSRRSNAYGYYGDSNPHYLTRYDNSPLGRITQEYGPGTTWQNKNKGITSKYLSNSITDDSLKCLKYNETSVTTNGLYYQAGMLSVTRTTDEDGHTNFMFYDKQGKTILSRTQVGAEYLDTYFVYDKNDNLIRVYPPLVNDDLSPNNLDKYAYMYKYDDRNRLAEKKLPGCQPVKYVYDGANRLIFMQDGNQRAAKQWSFILYDVHGRETVRGICTNTTLPNIGSTVVTTRKRTTGTEILGTGYEITVGLNTPIIYSQLQVANYYDDYSFLNKVSPAAAQTALTYGFETGVTSSDYGQQYASAKGLLTGKITCLYPAGRNLYSAYYYDDRGNIIQSRSTNHLNGYEKNYFAYSFTGKMLRHLHHHTAPDKSSDIKQLYTYEYDRAERLKKLRHKYNNAAEVTLVEYDYDGIGRMSKKKLHGLETNSLAYTYNVRSWVTGITGSKFTQNLFYNTGNGTPLYNGNVSSMTWKAGNETTMRGYKFAYDGASRLNNATYGEGATISTNSGRFNEMPTYDKHGNILSMKRYGLLTGTTYGLTDNLTFGYQGNQLNYVNDAVTGTVNEAFHFANGTNSTGQEYTYDNNGNLKKDSNKGITDIQYNFLNLPNKVTWSTNVYTEYVYDGDGAKRRTVHKNGTTTKTTDYCGNVIYEGNAVKSIQTSEGYIKLSGTTPNYYYYLQDHLGNNRVVINSSGVVQQTNHYYPFGGLFAQSTAAVQPFKYNGKELDTANGLNLYDYSARQMDPAIGRFTTMDPMAEKYYSVSPYAYVANNPMNGIDLKGDTIITIVDGQKLQWGKVGNTHGFVDSSGSLYSGKNKYVNSLTKAINSLRSKDTGRALVDYLAGDAGSVEIKNGESNSAHLKKNEIVWNNDFNNPGAPRPGFIGLGHEMAHIQDSWKKQIDRNPWFTLNTQNGPKDIERAEIYATHVENQLRSEHGKKLRTHYAYDSNGNGYSPSAILNTKSKTSLFYTNGIYNQTIIREGLPVTRSTPIPYKY